MVSTEITRFVNEINYNIDKIIKTNLEGKELKVDNYFEKASIQYLLLYFTSEYDSYDELGDINNLSAVNLNTKFDKVFLLDTFKNEAYTLK